MRSINNNSFYKLLWAALIILASACSKTESSPPETFEAAAYPSGVPEGTPEQKTVNAAGGTVTSPDGKLKLSIPPGALSTSASISVQAISNTLPLGNGTAYRISPADLQLSKPISVTLSYSEAELDGLDEEVLDLATQAADGTWKRMKKTQLQKNNRTLTVETQHLGDFSFTGSYRLNAAKAGLSPGESTNLTVYTVQEKSDEDDDEEASFGAIVPVDNANDFDSWNAAAPGTITSNGATAEFTAPTVITEPASVDVDALLKKVNRKLRATSGKLKLRKKIALAPASFMAGYYNGQPFTCVGVSVLAAGGITTVQGVTQDGKSVLIFFHGTDVGAYEFGNPSQSGKAEIRCNISGDVHETVYTICGPPSSTHYAGGSLKVNGYQNGGVIAGDFSTTLYDDSGCQLKTKTISGAFKVKM